RAALLATRDQAELQIVHVLPQLSRMDDFFGMLKGVSERMRLGSESIMNEQVALAKRLLVSRCCGQVIEGAASVAISSLVEKHRPDLLVIGAHGCGRLEQIFLGGTVSRILAHATCPLLVIRRDSDCDYQQLLVAVDFSACSERILKNSLALASSASATVVHAYEAPFEGKLRYNGFGKADIEAYAEPTRHSAQRNIDALLADVELVGLELKSRLVHGHPNSVLFEVAEELGADLMAIGHHAGTALEEKVMGSITKLVLYYAPCDVLVAAPKSRGPS
ncbi:MAG: universal stress protein, partial [Azonexus sp.]|nr:universal stress protein [Azonexus sp.]